MLRAVGTIAFVEWGFLLVLVIRIIAFGLRTLVLYRRKMLDDVKLFFHEYWEWKYLRINLMGFAFGLSSVGFFVLMQFLASGTTDVPLLLSLVHAPVISIGLLVGVVAIVGNALYRTREQHRNTYDICDHLDRLRWFRMYKEGISAVQTLPWLNKGAGLWANLGLSALSSASDKVVDRIIEKGMKQEIVEFAGALAVEYGIRVALVMGAMFLTRTEG